MDKTLSRDGTLIAYRRRGEGPPLILVGGALGTAETEAPLARLLAPRFDVVTYDRRGRGPAVTVRRTRWSARPRIWPRSRR